MQITLESHIVSLSPTSTLVKVREVSIITESYDNNYLSYKGFQLLGENSAMGAVYNSLERQKLDAPKCHPNTRVAVIQRIIDWILGEIALAALILWLYGAAGAGKSAIAHTLAEICEI